MSAVRPAWPLVLLAAAACFADNPPKLDASTGDPGTGSAGSTTTDTSPTGTADATGQGSTTDATTAAEDCPPGMSPTPWYIDQDGDDWGVGDAVLACTKPAGHAGQVGDCDDQVGAVNPGAIELCNEIDDDCDALRDEHSPLNEACGPCTLRERDGVAWWLCAVDGPNWQGARASCMKFGADLASIHGDAENTWLYDQVPALGLDLNVDTTLWLGLRRTDAAAKDCEASLDNWIWADGSPVDWLLGWSDTQPDNHPTADGCDFQCIPSAFDDPDCPRENCLDLIGTSGWNDVPCHIAGQGYICRAPAPSGP